MADFTDGPGGSAPRWFALAALVLCAASMAGAHALEWLTQSGRISVVAYRPPAAAPRVAAAPGVDPTPTGSVPSTAVVIRLH